MVRIPKFTGIDNRPGMGESEKIPDRRVEPRPKAYRIYIRQRSPEAACGNCRRAASICAAYIRAGNISAGAPGVCTTYEAINGTCGSVTDSAVARTLPGRAFRLAASVVVEPRNEGPCRQSRQGMCQNIHVNYA